MKKINLVIFGATGSIGDSLFSIIRENKNYFTVEAITCNKNITKLLKLANEFNVKSIGFNSNKLKNKNMRNLNNFKLYDNINKFGEMVTKRTNVIIFAISGIEPMNLLLQVAKSKKKIGIANKECIISLGNNLESISKKYKSQIIPLDSEHNSIFHLLKEENSQFSSITITASGGPFLNHNLNKLSKVTPQEALKHPIWKMGKKISIDSSTLMNKALEIIEAKYLFNLDTDQINAIIHPQSIVHAMINYKNGISKALLYNPDMRVPISSLFFDFDTAINGLSELSLSSSPNLEFRAIDSKKFPAINLAYNVLELGGIAPNIFNYLNECLVNNFLAGKIKFTDIVDLNNENMDKFFKKNSNINNPNYEDIVNVNNWIDKNLYLGK